MNIFKRKVVLKNFGDFHEYKIGERVIVKWGHDNIERVATVKKVSLHFVNGEPDTVDKNYKCIWKRYYFNEFDGWLEEEDIKERLAPLSETNPQ